MEELPRRISNPFTPAFGSMPYALAGRGELIDDVLEGLANQVGDPNRCTIFIGPRGSGKTVLLRAIARYASEQGWISVSVSAKEGMLDKICRLARANASHLLKAKGESTITSVQLGPVALTREKQREEVPWWLDVRNIVTELNAQGVGLLVTVDEVDPNCRELIDYIDTYQSFVSEGRDVALLMAGLPGQVMSLLLDKNVSFVRRAFQRPLLAIDQLEVEEALIDTLASKGKSIDDEALEIAAKATRGFAFAIQLVGFFLWRYSRGRDVVTVEDAERAAVRSARELERAVLEPTLQELSQRELQYVQAMAVDDGPSSTSEVAHRMGIGMTNGANIKKRLIAHGVVREIKMGVVDFLMPTMREYVRRRDTSGDVFAG